ncbi:GDSL esterase/lipase At5g08460 isoform X2 [Jatropha curcas]|uniref:GDSL esterase/lipase At5g08460 isoform X2 n=1 Tax=Jatropha curcas TaxID=180498 RepID=UPI0009D65D73|nr:GDSL esterase/lipase At5g08460 isoform X2 [Jatropha curcas]
MVKEAVLALLCIIIIPSVYCSEFPAVFVFGDSLVDDGNNNYLNSLAKSNYFPYGIDFHGGPTGRFCNGKTIIDFLATFSTGTDILSGVNYASAAAGILDDSGKNLGDRYTLGQQVLNFGSTLSQLKTQMDDKKLRQYLAKSLVVLNIGSNDYINNYLMPSLYSTSFTYNPKDFAHLLINTYTEQILMLQSLGLRKFLLAAVGPLGCIPNQLATGLAPPGQCLSFVNNMVQLFNTQLRSAVDELNKNSTSLRTDSVFVFGDTYGAFEDILDNHTSYGFAVTDRGCCGIGRNQGLITCLPLAFPCFNRDQYIFWDAYHPTQAFNRIIAQRAYSGPPSDCYPINVKQLAQL